MTSDDCQHNYFWPVSVGHLTAILEEHSAHGCIAHGSAAATLRNIRAQQARDDAMEFHQFGDGSP